MNKRRAEQYITVARTIAATYDYHVKFRHVSIVLSGKSIIAVGQNNNKTHTLTKYYKYKTDYTHSELDAFSKIQYKQGNFVLLNFRFNRRGELRLSKPCKYCVGWCVEFFDEIWFSTNNNSMEKLV